MKLVVADFNRDHHDDIALTSVIGNSFFVQVLLGDGTGHFTEASGSPIAGIGTQALNLVVADFNGDGNADLVVQDQGDGGVRMLFGRGDGTFMSTFDTGIVLPQAGYDHVFHVADMNLDGKLDLVVATFWGVVQVFLGEGTGHFTQAKGSPLGCNTSSDATVMDYNGDGIPDIVMACTSNTGSLTTYIGNGDGTLHGAAAAAPEIPRCVQAGGRRFQRGRSPRRVRRHRRSYGAAMLLNQSLDRTISVSSVRDPASSNEVVTLNATVTNPIGDVTPSGPVDFFEGSTNLGRAVAMSYVQNQSMTYMLGNVALPPGSHSITAVFRGDDDLRAITSDPYTQVVSTQSNPPSAPAPPPGPTPGRTGGPWRVLDALVGGLGVRLRPCRTLRQPPDPPRRDSHIEATPSGNGYWVVDATGDVYAFGDAPISAVPSLGPGESVTSLSATPGGHRYWLFTSRGRVLPFGDAPFLGDMSSVALNGPVIDSVATATGAATTWSVPTAGSSPSATPISTDPWAGPTSTPKSRPSLPDPPAGYWLVASDGGDLRLRRPLQRIHGRDPSQPAHQRHGAQCHRPGLSDGRRGRRGLHLRRRRLLRLPRLHAVPIANCLGGQPVREPR